MSGATRATGAFSEPKTTAASSRTHRRRAAVAGGRRRRLRGGRSRRALDHPRSLSPGTPHGCASRALRGRGATVVPAGCRAAPRRTHGPSPMWRGARGSSERLLPEGLPALGLDHAEVAVGQVVRTIDGAAGADAPPRRHPQVAQPAAAVEQGVVGGLAWAARAAATLGVLAEVWDRERSHGGPPRSDRRRAWTTCPPPRERKRRSRMPTQWRIPGGRSRPYHRLSRPPTGW